MSGGRFVESEMQYKKKTGMEDVDANDMGMGEWKVWGTEEDVVRQMRVILDRAVSPDSPNSSKLSASPSQGG